VRRKVDKGIIPAIQPDGPGTLLRFDASDVVRAAKQTEHCHPGEPVDWTNVNKELLKSYAKSLDGVLAPVTIHDDLTMEISVSSYPKCNGPSDVPVRPEESLGLCFEW
jgi:hypothetical protein